MEKLKQERNENNELVIPGHVVRPTPHFKEENEAKEELDGVHAENIEGTSADHDISSRLAARD